MPSVQISRRKPKGRAEASLKEKAHKKELDDLQFE
jgi:hypothetical protein